MVAKQHTGMACMLIVPCRNIAVHGLRHPAISICILRRCFNRELVSVWALQLVMAHAPHCLPCSHEHIVVAVDTYNYLHRQDSYLNGFYATPRRRWQDVRRLNSKTTARKTSREHTHEKLVRLASTAELER